MDSNPGAAPSQVAATPSGIIDAGLTARTLRLDRGLTLDQVCDRIGISKGHLSRFERGEKTLSAPVLARLADALGTSAERLAGSDIPDDWITLVRAGEADLAEVADGGGIRYRYRALSRLAQTAETFLIELPQGGQPAQTAPQAGHQGMLVLSGTLTLSLPGRTTRLATGDWIEFPAHLPHSLQAEGGSARFLLVLASL